MAALTIQDKSSGGAITTAAASAGGDTIAGGMKAGGWKLPTFLYATVGATATTITVAGTAYGPFTSQTVVIPVTSGVYQAGTTAITYSQVTAVAVAAVQV